MGRATKVIHAQGRHMVPGLLDAHMHVESGMVTVTEFVRAVLPRGTTGIFIDPHEIANVFGLKGVRLMVREAARQPIHVWVQVPSCVPAAPGLETSGTIEQRVRDRLRRRLPAKLAGSFVCAWSNWARGASGTGRAGT